MYNMYLSRRWGLQTFLEDNGKEGSRRWLKKMNLRCENQANSNTESHFLVNVQSLIHMHCCILGNNFLYLCLFILFLRLLESPYMCKNGVYSLLCGFEASYKLAWDQ